VLLPPLTGIEALDTNVSGGMLVINARLSLNMAAHTLDQVLSRRRKMLMDMCDGIALELRDKLEGSLGQFGVKVLNAALTFGALSKEPEWFNDDKNFSDVMSSSLHMQQEILHTAYKLHQHIDKYEISFRNWTERGLLGSRATMLIGWVIARASPAEVLIDLRDSELTQDDGKILAEALDKVPRLTSIDVRGNPHLTVDGANKLIRAMKAAKPGHPRSLCGVSPANTRLDVPRHFAEGHELDIKIVVAELDSHLFAESVTAGMGATISGDVIALNRRGGSSGGDKGAWQPLIWAAKVNHLQVAKELIDSGTNVNVQEGAASHSQKQTALHMACYKGHKDFVDLLLQSGADLNIQDVNGHTAKAIAQKKGNPKIVEALDAYAAEPSKHHAKKASTKDKAKAVPPR